MKKITNFADSFVGPVVLLLNPAKLFIFNIMKSADIFNQLYEAYFNRLIFHALRFVDDRAEAEDIVADVFADLWFRLPTLDTDGGLVSYLYRAVSTRSLNVLRHRNIAAVRIELLETINEKRLEFIDRTNLEDTINAHEIETGIREALSELPEKCREVFILSYINGLKSKEIAEAMDISVRTVEAHVYKALRIMRDRLKYLLLIILFFLGIE